MHSDVGLFSASGGSEGRAVQRVRGRPSTPSFVPTDQEHAPSALRRWADRTRMHISTASRAPLAKQCCSRALYSPFRNS